MSFLSKFGYMDKTGNLIIPAKYDNALPLQNGVAYVEIAGKKGCIDKSGNEIIPISYQEIWQISEGIFRVAVEK